MRSYVMAGKSSRFGNEVERLDWQWVFDRSDGNHISILV